ncbi:unnamed protein product [Closterium sp. NIES-54]
MLATDPYTCDLILTYAPPDTPAESHKYLERARSLGGVYVLDFNIPNFQASSDELVDLVPLEFPYMNEESWQHSDGWPWIRHSPHPCEINLHKSGPDVLCTTCFTPMASCAEEVERDYAEIQEAESAEAEPEGMTEMELAVTSHRVFGTTNKDLEQMEQERPTPRSETLRWVLEANTGTLDEEGRPRPYPRDVYRYIDTVWKDPDAPEELTVNEEEDNAKEEKKEKVYQERIEAGWDEESAQRAEKRNEPPPSKIKALDGSNYEEWSGRMRSAFQRYKLLKLAMGEEKMPEEGDARDRWIEKSAVLCDLILQSINNDMFQHIKDLVELDDSGPKAWKLLRDMIQPNTLPMVIVLEKELAALSMRPGDDVKPVLDKIKDTYARMAAAGSNVLQMQQCTKIISVLDNSWDNLIHTLNTQQD